MEEEAVESRSSRKEQERERRRLRDRERRQSMSQDERERHLARRRKNYQLRRQRAEVSRLDSQIQAIVGGSQTTMTSPPDSGASLVESDQSVGIQAEELSKLMGPVRLSRMKHLARTLNKSSTFTTDAEASNTGETDSKTRRAMSSGLRLSKVKRLVRSKGEQEGLLSQSQTQGAVDWSLLIEKLQVDADRIFTKALEDHLSFTNKEWCWKPTTVQRNTIFEFSYVLHQENLCSQFLLGYNFVVI